MAKSLCFQCRGPRFDPWPGNEIPHIAIKTQHSEKKKKITHLSRCEVGLKMHINDDDKTGTLEIIHPG